MEQEQTKTEPQEQQVMPRPTGNDFRPDKTEPPKAPLDEPKSKKRWVLLMLVILLLLAGGVVAYFFVLKDDATQPSSESSQQSEQAQADLMDPNTIRMLATGDFIAHDSVNEQAKTEDGYDYLQFMTAWQPLFDKTDINFCNVATPAGGEQYGISGYPGFNAPLEWNRDMGRLGCNLINTGTNHTNDKGQRVITAMLNDWDKHNALAVAGANRSEEEQQEVRYFEVKGVKFAFLSYSTYTNIENPNAYSLNMFNPSLYEPQMKEANEQADIVIVSMRWGMEYSSSVNSAQQSAAQTLSNLGADVILGHGAHYLQPVQELTGTDGNKTIVWYGLGNFLNTQLETEALTGCVAALEIDVPDKAVKSNGCLPFYMHYEWTAEEAAAEDLLKRHSLKIVPLDTAAELMTASQLQTTVPAQTERIMSIINTYIEVPVITAAEY